TLRERLQNRDPLHVVQALLTAAAKTNSGRSSPLPVPSRKEFNGSGGTAMYLKTAVIVTDVLTDPLWADYRDLAERCGLRACWSTPIISSHGEVLGSFAMYRQEPRGPNAEETRLTHAATQIASITIERQQDHVMLREREVRITLAAESA